MLDKSIERLLSAAVAIEDQGAVDAGELGFMARAMTLCTMPHSKPKGNEFRRKNGNYLLTMYSPHGVTIRIYTTPFVGLAHHGSGQN